MWIFHSSTDPIQNPKEEYKVPFKMTYLSILSICLMFICLPVGFFIPLFLVFALCMLICFIIDTQSQIKLKKAIGFQKCHFGSNEEWKKFAQPRADWFLSKIMQEIRNMNEIIHPDNNLKDVHNALLKKRKLENELSHYRHLFKENGLDVKG